MTRRLAGSLSTFLFAMPSPLSGAARLLDLFGQLDSYNQAPTPNEADALALRADWRMVGQDLEHALGRGTEIVQVSTATPARAV